MKAEIVQATIEHVDAIADKVRDPDYRELLALYNRTPREVLTISLLMSDFSCTGLIDGEPVCMFGVSPANILGSVGRPWMVGTADLDEHAVLFLRRCAPVVRQFHHKYRYLENYVDCRNVKAIEWLKWLGFSFGEPEAWNTPDVMVMKFRREWMS